MLGCCVLLLLDTLSVDNVFCLTLYKVLELINIVLNI